ncbi:MAG: hypothetical protein ABSG15_10385, partial [FCB group bacterium]
MKYFFSLLFICFLSTNLNAQWVECNNGLYAGNVNCIVVNDNEILAGTSRGIYKSIDNCESWKNIGFPYDNFQTIIQAITVIGNKIFIGTKFNGIFLSTDDGKSWTKKDSGLINDAGFSEDDIYTFA